MDKDKPKNIKTDMSKLIDAFCRETWSYPESNENSSFEDDMAYFYAFESKINDANDEELSEIHREMSNVMGLIRLKYGYESKIISACDDMEQIKEDLGKISIDSPTWQTEYQAVREKYNMLINGLTNLDFLHVHQAHNEGIYLALESLKSLVSNSQYRLHLDKVPITEVLVDCVKLVSRSTTDLLKKLEKKYKPIIQAIWKESLSSSIDNDTFRVLFSNIVGPLMLQANNMLNRPLQHSTSMISSKFIAIYGGGFKQIGFIYPNDSNIIMASAYDLSSNVFGLGAVNKEKGSSLVTPEVLEQIGINRAKEAKQPLIGSSCYDEVLVNAKPCGLLIIGCGEKDLNIFYETAKILSENLGLPLKEIDITDYKEELSDVDKDYIARHCILSYKGITEEEYGYLIINKEDGEIEELIRKHKDSIVRKFLELKKAGTLNKKIMCAEIANIIGPQFSM